MKTVYSVSIQATVPATASINILAGSEYEAEALALKVAESQKSGVKTNFFEIESYLADFLRFDGIIEITPDLDGIGRKAWDREGIEKLIGTSTS